MDNSRFKFRAWIEEEKRYFYFTLEQWAERKCNYSGDWDEKVSRSKEMEQFTGLHDKNGREIYEGDVIETETCYGTVCFEDGQFGFKVKPDNNYVGNLMDLTTWHSIEIIGNIHENSNLMEAAS